jgi:single-strand DNA-binding protein
MRSVNKVILIGNLTRDPEVRQTPNGQSVTTFGIATNREWVTRDGQRHTSSEYHEIVAWSRLAEICGQYLKKGKLVYIEGYLKTRSWDTPEGVKKFKTEIVIQDMIMLEKRLQNGETEQSDMDYIPEEGAQENMGMQMEEPRRTQRQEAPRAERPPRPERKPIPRPERKLPEPVLASEPKEPVTPPTAPAISGPIDIDQDLGL